MKKQQALANVLALALGASFAASANEVNYTFVEGGYARAEWADRSRDGFFAKGSAAFGQHFYGHLSYQESSDHYGYISFDETVLGVGYRYPVKANADLIAELSYVNQGVDVDLAGIQNLAPEHFDGYRAAIGVRGMMTPRFEGQLKGYYTEIGDLGGGQTGVQMGAVFHVNQTWGIVATYDRTRLLDEHLNRSYVGVRVSF